jgi:hypothetical protein
VNQAGFFRSGDDLGANPGLLDDGLEELAAVLGLARGARRDGDDLIHAV